MDAYPASIPQQVAAVLPADPSDQLALAHQIANHAYSAKVAALEQENGTLRQNLMQRQSQTKGLERRIATLELEVADAQEKARQSMEEQTKLVGEKNALISTVKMLNRDLAKLDNFKRNLLQSLRDEDGGDMKDSGLSTDYAGERLVHNVLSSVHSSPQQRFPASSHLQATPASTTSMLSKPPESTPWTANGAATVEGSPRVDGKEFFRQARARLAYEQFSQFLQNIKELNAHRQTREETLKKARDIFGPDNADLYSNFESLLSRHLPL